MTTPTVPAKRWGWRRFRDELIAFGWLVVIWNLLWGEFTFGNLLGGMLVAVAVLVFFPLPSVTFGGRLRPLALLAFVIRFNYELITASFHVAWLAVRPAAPPRSAIIGVPLRVKSDLNLTLTAEVVSLVPGTLIVDVNRETGTLYLHVLQVRGPEDLRINRQRVYMLERMIVRSLGSPAELAKVRAEPQLEGVSQ